MEPENTNEIRATISLRDWFAGAAMASMFKPGCDFKDAAKECYRAADAMMEASK